MQENCNDFGYHYYGSPWFFAEVGTPFLTSHSEDFSRFFVTLYIPTFVLMGW